MAIDVVLYFKGQDRKDSSNVYSFEEGVLEQLRTDFKAYCKDSTSMKGGCYECKWNEKPRVVFVKFDEILYIG